ncbi:MAG: DegT/DnrJ/EryC1/StrS family aminotransferase [Thiomargarita sp.]|nr:DegT/DnrJ/EryC1/StrS family aminotransferase [Thiomargarita sp.]
MINYPLSVSSWDESEIRAIDNVIKSDRYTMGKQVKQFEEAFSAFLNTKYCVMVNSGSSANLLAVASLFYRSQGSLKRGDEVIVPAVSWSTTYIPLYQYGLKLKFVDIDIKTLNYDLTALANAITDKTKLIVAVNLLGNPNDFNKIREIIGTRNIILIEDNCESMGAEFAGQQTGTFGLIGTFSSFFSHHISTMEGGLIATNNEEIYHILLSLRAHGWTRDLPEINQVSNKENDAFQESFRFVLPGYNVRPLEMSGAIGIEQLKKLPSFLLQRRKNAVVYQELFSNHPFLEIQTEIGKSSWFGFSFMIKPNSDIERITLVKKLADKGVECRPVVAGNFVNNEIIKWFDYEIHYELKNAQHLHENAFFIGNHHFDVTEKLNHVRAIL